VKGIGSYKQFGIRLIRVVLLFIGLSGPILRLFENSLIYHPEKAALPDADFGLPVLYSDFKSSDGVRLHGAYVPTPHARGTILWCHGNGGNLSYGFAVAREFQKFGVSMFLFDYRGYGKSDGSPGGDGILRDAEAAYRHLTSDVKIPPSRIVILGESLGGAPAIKLASEVAPAGLIVQSTFTSLRDMAGVLFPYMPWLRFFVRAPFENLETISAVRAPKLLIHSRSDEVVPFWMGRKLFDAAPQPKDFLELRAEGHNGAFGSREYIQRVSKFLDVALR